MIKNKTKTAGATDHEKKLVSLMSNGYTIDNMAFELGKNANTIASEIRFLRAKFQCTNSVHLVAYFLRNNIIK